MDDAIFVLAEFKFYFYFFLHNRILYGDQAKYFDMEVAPRLKHRSVGTVSMVNNGGNMHGSQVCRFL